MLVCHPKKTELQRQKRPVLDQPCAGSSTSLRESGRDTKWSRVGTKARALQPSRPLPPALLEPHSVPLCTPSSDSVILEAFLVAPGFPSESRLCALSARRWWLCAGAQAGVWQSVGKVCLSRWLSVPGNGPPEVAEYLLPPSAKKRAKNKSKTIKKTREEGK